MSTAFPIQDLTIRGLHEFIATIGEANLMGLGTTEVCDSYLKPMN